MIKSKQSDEEFTRLLPRRQLLLSLIPDDGWEWGNLQVGSFNYEIMVE